MKVLFVGAHTDDVELGCGGTIAKFKELGHKVTVLALSTCGLAELEDEFMNSTGSLSVSGIFYRYDVREFPKQRQLILNDLLQFKGFDMVFTHSHNDCHQDHKVVFEECLRAFKNTTILAYELPWNNTMSQLNYFVKIERVHLDAKWEALCRYKTQSHRHYMDYAFIESWAQFMGSKVCGGFAEGFEVIKMIQ